MPQDVTGQIDVSAIVDGQGIDAADVTVPFVDVIGVLNDMLNGVQGFERQALIAPVLSTLASDAFTVSTNFHTVAAESGTADDLATITTSGARQFLVLQADTGDTITVKHGTGNIFLNGAADFVLSGNKRLLLFFNGSHWSDVGAGGGAGSGVDFGASTELTIATGAVTRSGAHHTIDTESDAASDDLDTINVGGAGEGYALLIRAEHTDRTVVVKHGTGNIFMNGGLDFSLDNTEKAVLLIQNGTNWLGIGVPISGGGGGTVTSVALTVPGEFSVSGSPITTSGTLAVSKANQNDNLVFAGPASAGPAAPTFRALVAADLPLVTLAKGGSGADLSATGPGRIIQASAGAVYTLKKENYAATAAPTANDDGTQGYGVGSLWFDITNDKAYVCLDASTGAAVWTEITAAGGAGGGNEFLFSQTANQTITNTTSATTLFGSGAGSLTLSGGALAVGDVLEIAIEGVISTHSSAGTLIIALSLGGSTLATSPTFSLQNSMSSRSFSARFHITCRTTGASGTVIGGGDLSLGNGNTVNLATGVIGSTSTTTLDTTGALAVDATAQFGTASVNNILTLTVAVLKHIKEAA